MSALLQIALAYAPPAHRSALDKAWDFDALLGRMVGASRELMVGQMRLSWWHTQVSDLCAASIPTDPMLIALQRLIGDHDVAPTLLASLIEGWEALLEPLPLPEHSLQEYASKRGKGLFAISAEIMRGATTGFAGAGWALVDFAEHCSDPATTERALALARPMLSRRDVKAPKMLRVLAALAQAKAKRPGRTIAQPLSRWSIARAVLR